MKYIVDFMFLNNAAGFSYDEKPIILKFYIKKDIACVENS